jgi:hypothetical protein
MVVLGTHLLFSLWRKGFNLFIFAFFWITRMSSIVCMECVIHFIFSLNKVFFFLISTISTIKHVFLHLNTFIKVTTKYCSTYILRHLTNVLKTSIYNNLQNSYLRSFLTSSFYVIWWRKSINIVSPNVSKLQNDDHPS